MLIKTRFAPSPTGDLHLGGARTALVSWLFAKRYSGLFSLRIENTDRERSTAAATQVLNELLDLGHAYRCICSKERIDAVRSAQQLRAEKPRYDGHCRSLGVTAEECRGKPFVVRFANPTEGEVSFHDLVRGLLTVRNEELDDLILQRSDGVPTYNFCVVVDDWDMNISHVIRGEDHISNTFRQLNLLHALHAPRPQYAHLSMILDEQGNKLSKRTSSTNLLAYRDLGILPEAMRNYLLRLGWSHGDQEIFSLEEMVAYFSLDGVHPSPSAFDMKKLVWFNQQYLKKLPETEIASELEQQWHLWGVEPGTLPPALRLVHLLRDRVAHLQELTEVAKRYFGTVDLNKVASVELYLTSDLLEAFQELIEWAETAPASWEKPLLLAYIKRLASSYGLSLAQLGMALRIALVGETEAPGFASILETLGREESLLRLRAALQWMKENV